MLFARFSALPSKLPTRLAHLAGASVLAAVLAACGGSDTPRTSAVKVVGDSLADSGTFGNKYTVQSAAGSPTLIWTDHVTAAVDVPALCARYTSDASGNVSLNAAAPACTSFAVAGATINPTGTARDTTGYSIVQQLKDLGSSSYQFEDLLLVDGGGNDAAALLGAFIGASTPAGYAAYVTLLGELLSAAQLAAINPANPTTLVAAGSQYMVALANLLVDTLDAQAMAKGAQRVLVMNMPNVVLPDGAGRRHRASGCCHGRPGVGLGHGLGQRLQHTAGQPPGRPQHGQGGRRGRYLERLAGRPGHFRLHQRHHAGLPGGGQLGRPAVLQPGHLHRRVAVGQPAGRLERRRLVAHLCVCRQLPRHAQGQPDDR